MPDNRDIVITAEMLNGISEIDKFNSLWTAGLDRPSPDELKVMKRIATIESVGSSNRIEGNKMTDEQIEELFSRIDKKSFTTRDEQEVAGYSDLLTIIFDNYNYLNTILA